MKVITVLQPWAWLLATGKKRCETRSWKTNYRGEILIHAGKQNSTLWMKHGTIFEARHMKQAGVFDIELATGAIIGKADLVNCVRIDEAIHRLVREQHIEEDAFGNFSPGRYAWVMGNPVLFDTPISARGRQGLWNWEGEIQNG